MGELLTGPAGAYDRQNIADVVEACVQYSGRDGVAKLASQWRVSKSAVYGWRNAQQLPQLPSLLQICYRLNTTPLRLLTEGVASVDFAKGRELPWALSSPRHRRPRRTFEAERVRQALEDTLKDDTQPAPPMRAVAEGLGYAHSEIYGHLPELCQAISARYLAEQKQVGQDRIQQNCAEIRQIAIQLDAQGIYPSAYRIALEMCQPGFIRHRDGMATWHAVLRELGWES
jgi:hypothetical protein